MNLLASLRISIVALLVCTACHAENQHAPDYEVAMKTAAAAKKNTFILFTNSTVCAPCKQFKSDIYSKKEFQQYAKEHLVLLKIDYAPSFSKENKKSLTEIVGSFKLPTKIAHRGRGPWPYLIVISQDGKQLFSGRAYERERSDTNSFLKFLKAM